MNTAKRALREAQQIRYEEDFALEIAGGAMDRETGHFLATHPRIMLKWRDEQEIFQRTIRDLALPIEKERVKLSDFD